MTGDETGTCIGAPWSIDGGSMTGILTGENAGDVTGAAFGESIGGVTGDTPEVGIIGEAIGVL